MQGVNMELQITTLIENMQDDAEELICEHGLSLYIEFGGKRILFDTGQSGDFLKNAKKLGKSVQDVDYIVISHGHYDHSGGLPKLMEEPETTGASGLFEEPGTTGASGLFETQATSPKGIPMYIGAEFFDEKYKLLSDGTYRYNGNPFKENDLPTEKLSLHKITGDITYLEEDIILFKNFQNRTDFERLNPKFFVKRSENGVKKDASCGLETNAEKKVFADAPVGENYELDDFRDEMALGLCTSKGLVLIVGCSHVGIVNILQTVKERIDLPIYSVLGGTHLVEADEGRLIKTVEAMKTLGLQQIAVSHCTGEPGMICVEQAFGKQFVKNNTGNVYRV